MADKETRKRKKRKEGQKREESEEVPIIPKEKPQADWPPVEESSSHDVGLDPSVFAKSVFFILFSLLIVAVGVIFFTLHGVHPDPWDDIKENLQEQPHDGHAGLPSETVENFIADSEQFQSNLDSNDNEPTILHDTFEDDLPADQPAIDPSEMHPWAEHVPEEKPAEEQNFFNQIYEALGDELFEDDDHEDEEEDNLEYQTDDTHDDHADEDTPSDDLIQESFFKEETSESKDPHDAMSESFEVIVEEVEFPSLQTLAPLPDAASTAEAQESDSSNIQVPTPSLESATDPSIEPEERSSDFYTSKKDPEKCDSEGPCEFSDSSQDGRAQTEEISHPEGINAVEKSIGEMAEELGEAAHTSNVEASSVEDAQNPLPSSDEEWEDFDDDDDAEPVPVESSNLFSSVSEDERKIDWPESEVPQQASSSAQVPDHEGSREEPVQEKPEEKEDIVEASSQSKPLEKELCDSDSRAERGDQPSVVEDSQKSEEFNNQPYENAEITNEYDFLFKDDIDEADRVVEKEPDDSDFYFWRF